MLMCTRGGLPAVSSRQCLLKNAGVPIRYNLTRDQTLVDELLKNYEVAAWLQRLSDRVAAQDYTAHECR